MLRFVRDGVHRSGRDPRRVPPPPRRAPAGVARLRPTRFGRVVAGAALLAAGAARAAAAPPDDDAAPPGVPPPAEIESLFGGSSSCPRPDLVRAELATLLPPDRLSARLRAFPGTPAVVELYDLGVPFRVVAAGRVREYRDEARDCAYRARVAAVFVALTIDPASVASPPPPPPRPEPPARITEAPPVRLTPPLARLDVAAAVDTGFGTDRVAHGGAAVRLALGRGRYAFVAGALALLPADTSLGGVHLRQWRLPVDAGVRASAAGPSLSPYAELGLCAAVLSESAQDLASSSNRTAIEIGARAAIGARFGTSRFAPFAALHAELVPGPPAIFALPQGEVGHTPVLWLGAIAGASVGL